MDFPVYDVLWSTVSGDEGDAWRGAKSVDFPVYDVPGNCSRETRGD